MPTETRPLTLTSLTVFLLALAGCGEPTPSGEATVPPLPTRSAADRPAPGAARSARPAPEPSMPPPSTPPGAVPAATPPSAGAPLAAPAEDSVSIERLVLARAVVEREPQDPVDHVVPGTRVYAFIELDNPPRTEGALKVTWEEEGKVSTARPFELPYRATPSFRTWAYTTARRPGRYAAVVRTADGRELGRASFEVEAP